jgi:NAD(P)-dependent dehydrogenase (short-subunit alcohol dehydrogenase family)
MPAATPVTDYVPGGVVVVRVAVVSGANRGLGLEIVRQLAGRGLHVVLGSRSRENGEAAVAGLGVLAERVSACALDVASRNDVARLATDVRSRYGRCDVLVNNAAVALDGARDAATTDLDTVRRTLETNLIGAWQLSQALVPAMRMGRYGRIVNVSSGVGRLATMSAGIPAYRVSKCALNALTRILADELREDGILVNSCCPGRVRTGMGGDDGRSPAAAADTPVWLATLPDDGPTGGFYRERQPLEW